MNENGENLNVVGQASNYNEGFVNSDSLASC